MFQDERLVSFKQVPRGVPSALGKFVMLAPFIVVYTFDNNAKT